MNLDIHFGYGWVTRRNDGVTFIFPDTLNEDEVNQQIEEELDTFGRVKFTSPQRLRFAIQADKPTDARPCL
jgi:hypothetical protein